MTPEQLDEIEKLAAAATPGLWRAEADAAFIVAMREHALPLVKALREAWQERDEARAEVERLRGIVETYDDRFATMYDEARAEVVRLRATLAWIATPVAIGPAFHEEAVARARREL